MVCYAECLVLANAYTALCPTAVAAYSRTGYCLSHWYLGEGMHSGMRSCLACIEILSAVFRTVSLSLRTACNASAGHILLAVLADMAIAAADAECLLYYTECTDAHATLAYHGVLCIRYIVAIITWYACTARVSVYYRYQYTLYHREMEGISGTNGSC